MKFLQRINQWMIVLASMLAFGGSAYAEEVPDVSIDFVTQGYIFKDNACSWTENDVTVYAPGVMWDGTLQISPNCKLSNMEWLKIVSLRNIQKVVFHGAHNLVVNEYAIVDGDVWTGSAKELYVYSNDYEVVVTGVDVYFGEGLEPNHAEIQDPMESYDPSVPVVCPVEYINDGVIGLQLPCRLSKGIEWGFGIYPEVPEGVSILDPNGKPCGIDGGWVNPNQDKVYFELQNIPYIMGAYTVTVPAGTIPDLNYTFIGTFTVKDPIKTTVTYQEGNNQGVVKVTVAQHLSDGLLLAESAIGDAVTILGPNGERIAVSRVFCNLNDNILNIILSKNLTEMGSYTVSVSSDLVSPGYQGSFSIEPLQVDVKIEDNYVYVTLPTQATDNNFLDVIPEGLSVSDSEGNQLAITRAWYLNNDDKLIIMLAEIPNEPGIYTVNVPKGVVTGFDYLMGTFEIKKQGLELPIEPGVEVVVFNLIDCLIDGVPYHNGYADTDFDIYNRTWRCNSVITISGYEGYSLTNSGNDMVVIHQGEYDFAYYNGDSFESTGKIDIAIPDGKAIKRIDVVTPWGAGDDICYSEFIRVKDTNTFFYEFDDPVRKYKLNPRKRNNSISQIILYVIDMESDSLPGDINGDGCVNVSDVTAIINFILEKNKESQNGASDASTSSQHR